MDNWRRTAVWAIVPVVIAAAAVGLGVFLFMREAGRAGEATAKFMPASTQVYFSVNLRPGMRQMRMGGEVMSLLETDDFLDWKDDTLDDIEDDTGIHFLDDIMSWLGGEVSFALIDVREDDVEWVLLAEVGDRENAVDFLKDLVDYLEVQNSADFDRDEYRGADVWIDDDESLAAFGVTDEYLFAADSEDSLRDIIRNLESPPVRSLADEQVFIEARESLSSQRVAFLFIQTEDILGAVGDTVDLLGAGDDRMRQVRRNTPEYVAASISFIKKGIRFDLAARTPPSEAFDWDAETPLTAPDVVPADTLALYSSVGMREVYDAAIDEESSMAEVLEDSLRSFEDETGIDIRGDLADQLTGEIALSLLSSDLAVDESGGWERGGIHALLLAGIDDEQRVKQALDGLASLVEEEAFDVDRESLGHYEAVTVNLGDVLLSGIDWQPGYLVTEEWAVGGSTFKSLEAFNDATTGKTDSLRSADKFARLMDLAPNPIHTLFYVDIAGILEGVEDVLDYDTRSDYRRNVEPFVEPFDALLTTASITDEEIRITTFITLRE